MSAFEASESSSVDFEYSVIHQASIASDEIDLTIHPELEEKLDHSQESSQSVGIQDIVDLDQIVKIGKDNGINEDFIKKIFVQ
eukprot:CAMPEP_0116899744 /NCGR_PEP_ID=MMETSP0467-20121206/8242_1 /TAXON_ID=283647 /ORGANISM="Mesodinium pulex, Strain SPMC105" /LENGTH=82 /DNA_ID=CAMNT_0004572729 /DNA_START=1535 /DNA_END=1783 /DNA_ORIENTATION=+